MLECFICGAEVTDDDNEGDEENGLCSDCVPLIEEQYSDFGDVDTESQEWEHD